MTATNKDSKSKIKKAKVHCSHTELVPIDDVKPNPRNPNTHPALQIQRLAKIISEQGWRAPITISKRSGLIVRGHGRLSAAMLLGLKKVPIDYQNYNTEAEEHADMLADNRIAELSEINEGMLKELLVEIDSEPIDMELSGFSNLEYHELITEGPTGPEAITTGSGMFIKVGFDQGDEERMNTLYNQLIDDGYKASMTNNEVG